MGVARVYHLALKYFKTKIEFQKYCISAAGTNFSEKPNMNGITI